MLLDLIQCVFSGFMVVIVAIVKAIPLYFQLNAIKTEIIAVAFGVPTFVVTIVLLLPKLLKRIKK